MKKVVGASLATACLLFSSSLLVHADEEVLNQNENSGSEVSRETRVSDKPVDNAGQEATIAQDQASQTETSPQVEKVAEATVENADPVAESPQSEKKVFEKEVKAGDVTTSDQNFKVKYQGEWEDYAGSKGGYEGLEAKIKFIGHQFTIEGLGDSAKVKVLVDDKEVGEFTAPDAGDYSKKVLYNSQVFEEGEHTLRIQPLSSDTYFWLSAVRFKHNEIDIKELNLKTETLNLETKEEKSLAPIIFPDYATEKISYRSEDESVATVDDKGLVTGRKAGTTRIHLTSKQTSKVIEVAVKEAENNAHAFVATTDRHYTQKDYDSLKEAQSQEKTPFAWQNDHVNGEVVFLSKADDLKNVRVKATDFRNGQAVLSSENVKAYFLKETSAHVGRGFSWGKIPGQSVPREYIPDILDTAESVDVKARSLQPIWLKIHVPKGTMPGLYKGYITITADNTEKEVRLPYQFEVLPYEQPSDNRFSMELWQYPYTTARYYGLSENEYFSDKHLELLRQELSEYKKIGGDSVTVTISEDPWHSQTYDKYPSMVKWTKEADGRFKFDFSAMDKYVDLALSLGINKQIKSFSLTPWENNVQYFDVASQAMKTEKLPTGSDEWKNVWGQFLSAYIQHLDQKGWFQIAYMAMDERPIKDMKEVLKLIHQYKNKDGKHLKISAAMNYSADNAEVIQQIDDISIVLSHIEDVHTMRKLAQERRAKGQTTTLYTCVGEYPSSFTRSSPAESAWTIWYAEAAGLDGFLRWAYDAWVKDPETSVDHWWWESGDPFLVYPANKEAGNALPRTSPRFEKLKEAKANVEKLRLLKASSAEAAKEIDDFLATIKREYGKQNEYGAMQSTGEEQDQRLAAEVERMTNKLYEFSKKYGKAIDFKVEAPRFADQVTTADRSLTLTAPAHASLELLDQDGKVLAKGTADETGKVSLDLARPLLAGEVLSARASINDVQSAVSQITVAESLSTLLDPATGIAASNDNYRSDRHRLRVGILEKSLPGLVGRDYLLYDLTVRDKASDQELDIAGQTRVFVPTDKKVAAVYFVTADGRLESRSFVAKAGGIEFTTEHFSEYAVLFENKEQVPIVQPGQGQKASPSLTPSKVSHDGARRTASLPATGEQTASGLVLLGFLGFLAGLVAKVYRRP